jgi:hypothetical protein
VERVVKGELRGEPVVTSAADGASCGAELVVGRAYRVHAGYRGDGLHTGLCSGNEALSASATAPPHETATAPPQAMNRDNPATPASGTAVWLSALGVAAVAAGSTAVAVRHRRRAT